jgi:hypothetical protein
MHIQVENFTVTKTSVIDNIKIRIINLELFKSVSVTVSLLNGDNWIENRHFTLSGDDYKKWGNDDKYLTNYILSALNITTQIPYTTTDETPDVTPTPDSTPPETPTPDATPTP